MKFTVVWTDSAEQDLAQFWLGARNRISIDEATQRIEAELATNPLHAGESRVGNGRAVDRCFFCSGSRPVGQSRSSHLPHNNSSAFLGDRQDVKRSFPKPSDRPGANLDYS